MRARQGRRRHLEACRQEGADDEHRGLSQVDIALLLLMSGAFFSPRTVGGEYKTRGTYVCVHGGCFTCRFAVQLWMGGIIAAVVDGERVNHSARARAGAYLVSGQALACSVEFVELLCLGYPRVVVAMELPVHVDWMLSRYYGTCMRTWGRRASFCRLRRKHRRYVVVDV